MLVAMILTASLVSGDTTVVKLLIGDSSIGESDIGVVGGVLEGSIIGVDSTATTFDVNCALTTPVQFPFQTPLCVGGAHVTITQGPSTAFMSQVYIVASTSENIREDCSFSNTDTVTCSLSNVVSKTFVVSGQTTTTLYTDTSSGVNASPTNGPLYFPVTITAGLEKLGSVHAKASPTLATTVSPSSTASSSSSGTTTVQSRTSSAPRQTTFKGMWAVLLVLFVIAYSSL